MCTEVQTPPLVSDKDVPQAECEWQICGEEPSRAWVAAYTPVRVGRPAIGSTATKSALHQRVGETTRRGSCMLTGSAGGIAVIVPHIVHHSCGLK